MKIALIGYSGAGKTTLAEALRKELHCEIFHVDDAMYDESIRQREAAEAMAIAEARMAAMNGPDWIIDGYRAECVKEEWLADADRIGFFNLGRWICFWRAVKRYAKVEARWIKKCAMEAFRRSNSENPVKKQMPDRGRGKPSSHKAHALRVFYHLRHIIIGEHDAVFEASYMDIGRRYPEKFTVLRTQKEVRQFRETILKETKSEEAKR